MTFSGRIRLSLVAAAVLPTLLIMLVIYFHFERQVALADEQRGDECARKYAVFNRIFQVELVSNVEKLIQSSEFSRALANVQSGRTGRLEVDPRAFELDFLELIDSTNTVLATYHRPGLLGQKIEIPEYEIWEDTAGTLEKVEYDLNGAHAAFVHRAPVSNQVAIYTGKYMHESLMAQLSLFLDASVKVFIPPDSYMVAPDVPDALYPEEGLHYLTLDGGEYSDFILGASFPLNSARPTFITLFSLTGLVAIVAVMLSVIVGFYITGRAKREVDNLVSATARVAAGDFNTPVMAYEEGEFSELADSFSEMMLKLKQTQKQLATTEKIAAWQTVGRKIAHEIKNPLTPIAISVDDLRRSHSERLPEFDKVLNETTRTIKSELDRLIKLLDEFVRFARMKAPEIREVKAAQFVDELRTLYKADIDSGRVSIDNKSTRATFQIDPEAVKQVLINLIKNGLESSSDSTASVTIADIDKGIKVTVEDTGPGFTEDKLVNSFEPYVSTKEGGSGLGLVICHRIVHDHGGAMELYNKPDKGAGVRIILPQ
ncbi:MAG: HAMP domain-containing protein [Candidatus Zixiibacteriota bacterium]|nr:MAG: HAMP domain-containing protein [candidate division Zixibacteria bacterium]